MRAAWQIARSGVSARPSRTALLIGAVALSAALIAAVSSAMRSLNASVKMRTDAVIGSADLRLEPAGSGQTLDASIVGTVRTWEGVDAATGRLEASLSALAIRTRVLVPDEQGGYVPEPVTLVSGAVGVGIMQADDRLHEMELIAGRLPEGPGEVALDALLLTRLGWRAMSEPTRARGFGVADIDEVRSQLDAGPLPTSVADADRAQAANRVRGVRLGDTLTVVPAFVAPDSTERALRRVIEALELYPAIDTLGLAVQGLGAAAFAADGVRLWRAFQEPRTLEVVGVIAQPPLGGRPRAILRLEDLQGFAQRPGRISRIDIKAEPGVVPEALADRYRGTLEPGLILQTTERITSGLDKNLQSSQLGLILATVLAVLSASFIIMTGLTTDMTQRQRELAMLRCVGSTRTQLVQAQVLVGLGIGLAGGVIGVPFGLAVAWALAAMFPEQVPSGVVVVGTDVGIGLVASVASGVLGSLWPAYRSASVPPLRGLRPQAQPASARGVALTGLCGVVLIGVHLAIILVPTRDSSVFWVYAGVGLPAMFVGYFLLGVPMVALAGRVVAPVLSAGLSLPAGMLGRGVRATPYRIGFTSGAMMTGLAMIVAIWSNGQSVLRDWIGAMEFPDAYASGLPLDPGAREAVEGLGFVERTSVISRELVGVEGDASLGTTFGGRDVSTYQTSFIGFEPRSFFQMMSPTWVQGSLERAMPRLEDGTGILVAREFHTARGIGVGDPFTVTHKGREFTFEIVGVVTSPGLDIASKFFNIGEEYTHQAVHAVFGSMRAMERFGADRIHIIQIDLREGVDTEAAMAQIRTVLAPYGLLDAGSGVGIKQEIERFATDTILVFSSIGLVAMLVACFGVANLIAASIDGRRYEFGVLRAVGCTRGVILRLLLAEAIIVAAVASVLGVLMGMQAALGGRRVYELILGIRFEIRPAIQPISIGIVVMATLTIGAAVPAILRLNRSSPRDLLASI